jgi:hypothetical protein
VEGVAIITSSYLPYDSDKPLLTNKVRDIGVYCCSRERKFIIGCDANAHHILQEKTGTNHKESLIEYLVSLNLNILNQSNELQ